MMKREQERTSTIQSIMHVFREPETRKVIAMILGLKFAILLFGGQAYQIFENKPIDGWHGWLKLWQRWDANHYLDIAEFGYPSTGPKRYLLVFFPLYPWLTRLFTIVTNDYLVSAFLVSGLATLAAGVLLYRLVQLECPDIQAHAPVWFMFIFPTSFFLHIPYTESLLLALAIGCMLGAGARSWMLASLLAALGGLTRIT